MFILISACLLLSIDYIFIVYQVVGMLFFLSRSQVYVFLFIISLFGVSTDIVINLVRILCYVFFCYVFDSVISNIWIASCSKVYFGW